jgi:hypothetical protein
MKAQDLKFIAEAAAFFETPTTFTRALNGMGTYIEGSFSRLPVKIKNTALKASRRAIEGCLNAAVKTLDSTPTWEAEKPLAVVEVSAKNEKIRKTHTIAAGAAGAIGGFFGPLMMAVELPVSTALIMRSIAATARDFGFDPKSPEILTESLFVFAIGGPSKNDDGMDSVYLASRLAMSSIMRQAALSIAGLPAKEILYALEREAAPAMLRLVTAVSESFGVRVSQKFMAQAAPVLGAAGGAAINVAFADFFGKAARFHFGMKRLEQVYGADVVQGSYKAEAAKLKT